MKVNQKTTSYLIAIAFIHLILVAFVVFIKILKPFQIPLITSYILNFLIASTCLTVIIYLSYILTYLNEKRFITIIFQVYAATYLLSFIRNLLVKPSINGTYFFISFIIITVVICFIIQLFKIKNPVLAPYFKLLALTMLFSTLFSAVGPILMVMHYVGRSILMYIKVSDMLPPGIIVLILYKTSIYLTGQQIPFKQANINDI
jgi:hypothetical protein